MGKSLPPHAKELELAVLQQPDNTTCGPTCLHAVYRYWGTELPLTQIVGEVGALPEGGTLAVNLAGHALKRGFTAEIITYNLLIFDPTWFWPGMDLAQRLREQSVAKNEAKISHATEAYLEFIELGGVLRHEELTPGLLRRYLDRDVPILTGLSATYLYNCARELDDEYDDIRGYPTGHFVVLTGYDRVERDVLVADPLHDNPAFSGQSYRVDVGRLIASILLGIVTYDANLLIITPK